MSLLGDAVRWVIGPWRNTTAAWRIFSTVQSAQPETYRFHNGQPTMVGSLENLARAGFYPSTIIDVGAFIGEWSRRAAAVFPDARIVMIEANPNNRAALELAQQSWGSSRTDVHIALLGAEERSEQTFHLTASGTGSSVLAEQTENPQTIIRLPMRTLDATVGEVSGPILLKLDVQGYELEVLKGAPNLLSGVEVIVSEIALLEYNEGAPLFADVMAYLNSANFALYDLCGMMRRETDHALFQVDAVFAREASALRAAKPFWLAASPSKR
jgi:FkbM family methyltransferase